MFRPIDTGKKITPTNSNMLLEASDFLYFFLKNFE